MNKITEEPNTVLVNIFSLEKIDNESKHFDVSLQKLQSFGFNFMLLPFIGVTFVGWTLIKFDLIIFRDILNFNKTIVTPFGHHDTAPCFQLNH